MSFIRAKKINGKHYFYLVSNSRINGKVRQKVVKYLGKSENILSLMYAKRKKAR